MLRHLDLFSGIGGFALAARMVGGYETIGFCEIEPYCQAVLRRRFPGVPIHDDVRSIRGQPCDVITGGFPCQPYSQAGKRMGREDDRNLWPDYRRVIQESGAAWVVGENVLGLVAMELDNVLADLESIGYAAVTFSVPACAVGARHIRERIWILAHADEPGPQGRDGAGVCERAAERIARACGASLAYSEGESKRTGLRAGEPPECRQRRSSDRGGAHVVGDTISVRELQPEGRQRDEWRRIGDAGRWSVEPDVGRVAHGIPARVDRLRALGNAIVPQVAAIFLEAIKETMTCDTA